MNQYFLKFGALKTPEYKHPLHYMIHNTKCFEIEIFSAENVLPIFQIKITLFNVVMVGNIKMQSYYF